MKKTGPTPVSDATRSDFHLRQVMIDRLEDTGKQFKVKFDILSLKFLKDIARNGSRLLHITSDIESENTICLEGRHGIANDYPLKTLENKIRLISRDGLLVDVIGIGIPNSVNVGKMF